LVAGDDRANRFVWDEDDAVADVEGLVASTTNFGVPDPEVWP
jgi:hypothetical protein